MFAGRGLPQARHVVEVDLDPGRTLLSYDPSVGVITFVSPGTSTSIRHGYTRAFPQTGPIPQGQVQPLAEWSFPNDMTPDLLRAVMAYGLPEAGRGAWR